ncbi:hypothetical protein Tco_0736907 [Tanacetum coccineum]
MKNLKNQLQDLERQHKQNRTTSLIDDPWRLPSTPFVGVSFDPQPLPQSYTNITSPSLNIWASEQRKLKPSTRKEPTFLQESQSIADVVALTKTPDVLPIQKYYTIDVVIKRFLTRLQGRLRDWYHSLESLRNVAYQALEARNVTIAQTTLGELYQLILNALAKLCNQKKFLAKFERTGKRLGIAGDDKYLQIKYDDDDARSLWSLDEDEHFDPFKDDPTYPNARWNP